MAGLPGTPATPFTFPARKGPIIRHFISEYSDGGISCALAGLLVQKITRTACTRKKAAPFQRTVFNTNPSDSKRVNDWEALESQERASAARPLLRASNHIPSPSPPKIDPPDPCNPTS